MHQILGSITLSILSRTAPSQLSETDSIIFYYFLKENMQIHVIRNVEIHVCPPYFFQVEAKGRQITCLLLSPMGLRYHGGFHSATSVTKGVQGSKEVVEGASSL